MSEVAIVGGGPVGLTTAIALRRTGREVLVLERARPPIDKACGEGLMPDALARLREIGVQLAPAELRPFYGIRYLDGSYVAEGRFPWVDGTPVHGAGVRRLCLHAALVRRAEEVGVEIAWETRVERLRVLVVGNPPPGAAGVTLETSSGDVEARWVVGADGLRSRVRRWLDLAPLRAEPADRQRFGVRRHFAIAPWSDLVEVYWADGCEAYVTPTAENEVGVAILWSGRKAGFDTLLRSFPALGERLSRAPTVSRDRGMGPLLQRSRGVARGRVALVGDAAGYVDAITGEGLAVGLHQAVALASAIEQGDLGLYVRRNRRIVAWPESITRLLLWAERRPAARRAVVRMLGSAPWAFSRLLGIHGGCGRDLVAHSSAAPSSKTGGEVPMS